MSLEYLKCLAKELTIWSGLEHANILPFFGFCMDDDDADGCYPSLVSLWMDNGTVRDYLEAHPESNIVVQVCHRSFIVTQHRLLMARLKVSGIAEGLKYLHDKDVVHSDLKPVCHLS